MSNILLEDEFERVLRKVSLDKPLFDAIALLEARLKRLECVEGHEQKRDLICAARRELGIAYLSAGDVERAITALEQALSAGGLIDPEVRAYLGRALVEQGDDLDAAVSHLQDAIALWAPTEPPAHVDYYYGRALRERMENRRREDSARLGQAWHRYLQHGAPLGHRSEIEEFFAKPSR
jgi:tetratricopeptide (TPR) repeat protein